MRVDERLLKYVSYWTTSSEDSDTIPSTDRQFNLAKELEKELLDLGLQKVTLTDHCYIYGLIPATPGYEDKKAVGFISHMDTALTMISFASPGWTFTPLTAKTALAA